MKLSTVHTRTFEKFRDCSNCLTPFLFFQILAASVCKALQSQPQRVTSYNSHLPLVSGEFTHYLAVWQLPGPAVTYWGPWVLFITCEGIIIIVIVFLLLFSSTLAPGATSPMERLSSCQKEVMSFRLAVHQRTARSKGCLAEMGWMCTCVSVNTTCSQGGRVSSEEDVR